MAPQKFRWSIDGGDTWTYEEEDIPFNLTSVESSDSVLVEPIGEAVVVSAQLPAALGWASARFPVNIQQIGGEYILANQEALARAQVSPDTWTGPIYYVDYAAGSDSNTGLSWGEAVKNQSKPRQLGQATGAPFRVMLKENGVWPRAASFHPATYPVTVDHAILVENGGNAIVGVHDNLTYTLDGTYTDCYRATRSGVDRSFDPSDPDADGVYSEYVKYADPAALQAAGAVDGWAQSGSNYYVRRADGGEVSDANCRAYVAHLHYEDAAATASVYVEGVHFEGGSTASLHVQSTGARNVVTSRCSFGYSGLLGFTERDAYRLRNFDGIALSLNDRAVEAYKDGFNLHVDAGSNVLYGLFVNPKTRKIGTELSNSKNAFTLHETTRAIVLNPDFTPTTNGSTVANVGDSTCMIFGGTIEADEGSGSGNGAIAAADNAKIWLVGTEIVGDIVVAGSATVYLRNCDHTGDVVTLGPGQVVSF